MRVTGTVGEFTSSTGAGSSQTQLSSATVEVLESGVATPAPAQVTFPVASTTYLERFEGMLVELPQADVDYLFLQVVVERPEVSDRQNCGNILAGVGHRGH